jgi:YVTN family beta-propeller protein
MNTFQRRRQRALVLVLVMVVLTAASSVIQADTGTCGGASTTLPFTDVPASNIFFCSIASAYFAGLTNGTSATTYGPSNSVTREQMAAFVTRTHDSALKRGNKRAITQQWWTPTMTGVLHSADLGTANNPNDIVFDGADLWVANSTSATVSRVRASDGRLLTTWGGATDAESIIAAAGRIFIVGRSQNPGVLGKIYVLNPDSPSPPPPVTVFEDNIGVGPRDITFDGANLWTANAPDFSGGGSVSRVNIVTGLASTFTAGFVAPLGILWDGANLWVADAGDDTLKRVDPVTGGVLESIPAGVNPYELLFDGMNIWVSNSDSSVTVVRAVGGLRGTVLATLTGNGLNSPAGMAFDGERVLVCNDGGNETVSLFKAADFTPLGSLVVGPNNCRSIAACSDGVSFWIVRTNQDDIVRF